MAAGVSGRISIQKLFLVTITLKIASSVAGWWLGSPWILGFAVPVGLMFLYISMGLYRGDDTVSDEKFADSCYYLGFIFTISSILIALLDIPSISARIGDISVRFGAAMVTTVLGLIVRVYLVNFRPEFQESVRIAEDGLLNAVRGFRIHLELSLDKLREFQNVASDAFKLTVGQADQVIRDAAADHARHFRGLSEQLAADNRALLEESATHMKAATQTLSNVLYDYARTLVAGSEIFESNVQALFGKLDTRLQGIALPEDYFADRLDPAVARLGQAVAAAGSEVAGMVVELRAITESLSTVLEGLRDRTFATSAALDRIAETVLGEVEVQALAKEQVAVFRQLGLSIEKMETAVNRSMASLGAMEQGVRQVVNEAGNVVGSNREVGAMVRTQVELTREQETAFSEWLSRLDQVSGRASDRFEEAVQSFERAATRVAGLTARHEATLLKISGQLDGIVGRLAEGTGPSATAGLAAGRRFGTDA